MQCDQLICQNQKHCSLENKTQNSGNKQAPNTNTWHKANAALRMAIYKVQLS